MRPRSTCTTKSSCCNRHLRSAACLTVQHLFITSSVLCSSAVSRLRRPFLSDDSSSSRCGCSTGEGIAGRRFPLSGAVAPACARPKPSVLNSCAIIYGACFKPILFDRLGVPSRPAAAGYALCAPVYPLTISVVIKSVKQVATRHGRCIWLWVDRGPGTRRSRRQKRAGAGWRRPFFQVCAHSAAPSDAELYFLLPCLPTAVPSRPDACILQRPARRSGEMPSDAAGVSG